MRIRWFVTDACNLHCRQCNIANFKSKGEEDIAGDEAVRIINEFAEAGVRGIQFLGGEPLLRADFTKLLQHCKHRGLDVWLITNGYFVDKKMAEELVGGGLDLAVVSIDGTGAASHDKTRGKKGSFERAKSAVENFDAARRRLNSSMQIYIDYILMRTSVGDLEGSLAMAKSAGADLIAYLNLLINPRLVANAFGRDLVLTPAEYWSALHVIAAHIPAGLKVNIPAPPRVTDYLSRRYNVHIGSVIEGNNRCGLGTFDLHHNGYLYPCGEGESVFHQLFAAEPGWDAARSAINLRERRFTDVVFSTAYTRFLQQLHDRADTVAKLPDICRGCAYSPVGVTPRCVPACHMSVGSKEESAQKLGPVLCSQLAEDAAVAGQA
jgi:MoaA/NifB/PqqE/SkfB family radical SAM enzyme